MFRLQGRALIFGSRGGLGGAFYNYLSDKLGCENVTSINRSHHDFEITDEKSLEKIASKTCGPFQLIINATGVLDTSGNGPEKTINSIRKTSMIDIMSINAVGPALLLKFFSGKLDRDAPSVFVNLSARVGSIEDNKMGGWISYRASKAALNQIIKTASIEIQRKNKNAICIGLHPGTVKTQFTKNYHNRVESISAASSVSMLISVIKNIKFSDNGKVFAYDGSVIPW